MKGFLVNHFYISTASEVPVEMALSELLVEASRFAQLTLAPPTDELY